MLRHLLHHGGDGGGDGDTGASLHGVVDQGGGGCSGGINGNCHHLLHHLLNQGAEPYRDVVGRASQDSGVDHVHGEDDGGHGGVIHPLVDGWQVKPRRHLFRVPLNMVLKRHHVW